MVALAAGFVEQFEKDAFTNPESASLVQHCIETLRAEIGAPDISLAQRRKAAPKLKPVKAVMPTSVAGRGRGRGFAARGRGVAARGRGGRPAGRGRAVPLGRGRASAGRGLPVGVAMPGRGRARGAVRGRVTAAAPLQPMGRGRGVAPAPARPDLVGNAPPQPSVDEEKSSPNRPPGAAPPKPTPKDDDGFRLDFDPSNRWSVPTVAVLFPMLRQCVLDSKRGKNKGIKTHKMLPSWSMSLLICQCHDTVNLDQPTIPFPSAELISLFLDAIPLYTFLVEPIRFGVCQLSPALHTEELKPLLSRNGILSGNTSLRNTALAALKLNSCMLYPQSAELRCRLWITCHDTNEEIKQTAIDVWKQFEFKLDGKLLDEVIALLGNQSEEVRKSMAGALAEGCRLQPQERNHVLKVIIVEYGKHKDEVIKATAPHQKPTVINKSTYRHGVSLCLAAMGSNADFSKENVMKAMDFLLKFGLAENREHVFKENLETGRTVLKTHGGKYAADLFEMVDKAVGGIAKKKTNQSDMIRTGLSVYMACLVKQIPDDDSQFASRVEITMNQLLDVLRTPSYEVQFAVAHSLQDLISKPVIQARAKEYVNKLLRILTMSEKFPERKGAAIGLAAIVKGLGVPSVARLGIMDSLKNAVTNRESPAARQGALLTYTQLFEWLGRHFEPYVVKVYPHLLTSFGDGDQQVRKVTAAAARAIMKNLTSNGIKMVLPHVLMGLADKDSRVKVQSANMLGSMADCSSKVLATHLPEIIPKLCAILIHPKKEVTNAGHSALKSIGSVVRNPEISALVPLLIKAITSPGDNTRKALDALIHTSFTNLVDVSSLAMIIPILIQAMKDRSSNTKQMAAQVIGGISSLIAEPRSLLPYIPELVSGLQSIVCDPIPDVRTASAMALKSLNLSLGEEALPGVYQWLLDLLEDETTNNVRRFGAAEGISELLASYGSDKIQEVLPMLLEGLESENAIVRESFAQVFVFLPKALGDEFPQFMDPIIPSILEALGDEKSAVRAVALQAGKIMVYMFHQSEYDLLLELLEEGLEHEDYLVRQDTVVLIGDLLHGLGGGSGSVSYETSSSPEMEKLILDSLGEERRNEVFSLLYMAKSDAEQPVRQKANMTWKGLVYNAAKMLKTILDTLMHALITSLSSPNPDRQEAAGRALGDLVTNAGQFIIPKIIPILEKGLQKSDGVIRQGVCLGLAEVLSKGTQRLLESYRDSIIPSVRFALCDELSSVRQASGRAFARCVSVFGDDATNSIVPYLVQLLDRFQPKRQISDPTIDDPNNVNADGDDDYRISRGSDDEKGEPAGEQAGETPEPEEEIEIVEESGASGRQTRKLKRHLIIEGLRELLRAKPDVVLPHLIPILIQQPITEFHMRTLSELAPDMGEDIYKYIPDIFKSIAKGSYDADTNEIRTKILAAGNQALIRGVSQMATHLLLTTMVESFGRTTVSCEMEVTAMLLSGFCKSTKNDFSENVSQLIAGVLTLFPHHNERVRVAAWTALKDIMASMPDIEITEHIDWFRDCLRRVVRDSTAHGGAQITQLEGFCIPNGLQPIMVMFDYGIRNGTMEERTSAAQLMGELIELSTLEAIKPFLSKVCGALIRICADRFPQNVKSSILHTLKLLLDKYGKLMKGFYVPLQTTFVKVIHDPSSEVRRKAGEAMAALMKWSPKVDTLIRHLTALLKTREKLTEGIQASVLDALSSILNEVGAKVKPEIIEDVQQTLSSLTGERNDDIRAAAAHCLGSLCTSLSTAQIENLLTDHVLDVDDDDLDWREVESRLITLSGIVEVAFSVDLAKGFESDMRATIAEHLDSEHVLVKISAGRAGFALLGAMFSIEMKQELCAQLLETVTPLLRDGNSDVRQYSAMYLSQMAQRYPQNASAQWVLSEVLPYLLKGVNDNVFSARAEIHTAILNVLLWDNGGPTIYNQFCANPNSDDTSVKQLQNFIVKYG